MTFLKNFINDEEGQDLVEYALLIGFIAIIALVGIKVLGTGINAKFTTINASLT